MGTSKPQPAPLSTRFPITFTLPRSLCVFFSEKCHKLRNMPNNFIKIPIELESHQTFLVSSVFCLASQRTTATALPFVLGFSLYRIASWLPSGSRISLYSRYPLTNDFTRLAPALVCISQSRK